MNIEFPEDLRSVQQVCVIEYFLNVESQKRQVEQKRNPIPIDKEEEGQEAMDGSFGNNVCVEAVAEVDGVDVVTFQITIHDSEEHLQEQVDGINQYRQQVQPCLAGHHDGLCVWARRRKDQIRKVIVEFPFVPGIILDDRAGKLAVKLAFTLCRGYVVVGGACEACVARKGFRSWLWRRQVGLDCVRLRG